MSVKIVRDDQITALLVIFYLYKLIYLKLNISICDCAINDNGFYVNIGAFGQQYHFA